MLGQQRQGIAVQFVLAAQLLKDRLAQRRNILQPFTQRRHLDRQHVEAVIQIGAKLATLDRRFQVHGRRGNHPHIAVQHLVGAHRFEFLFLQHPQQFALQWQRHVADFIEKQRAALGDLELAGATLAVGTGKGAGRSAEELGFKQVMGNRRAVDAHKSFVRPGRCAVDGLGEQLLAGAGFPEQQYRRLGTRTAPRPALDLKAGGAGADKVREVVFALPRTQQRARGGQLLLHAQVALDQRRQVAQFIEQRKPNRADHRPGLVVDRQAHHHQRALGGVLDVQQDRPVIAHHLAQQAVGNHLLARLADGLVGALEAKTLGVTLVHPHDIRIAVDDDRALAGLLDDLEQRLDGQAANLLVVLEAGTHGYRILLMIVPTLCVGMSTVTLCVTRRRAKTRRGASRVVFPRRAWEQSHLTKGCALLPAVLWCTGVGAIRTHHGSRHAPPPCHP